ncbi:MAG: hypothetical protein U1F43_37650 [Myxococcota bacterium]
MSHSGNIEPMSTTSEVVSAEAVRAMSDAELEHAVAELSAQQIDEAEHRLLTLVREMDRRERHRLHGLPSMAAWLGWRVGSGRWRRARRCGWPRRWASCRPSTGPWPEVK